MVILALVLAVLAAALHCYIWWLESFVWTTRARAVFGTTRQQAEATRELAFNQGFYNLFLALIAVAGVAFWGAGQDGIGAALLLAGTGSMLAAPLLLTVVGIGVGYLPGVPLIEVDREIVLLGLLPPLLYAAAIRTSLIDLRANLRGIALLSVGLVIFTALGVGLVVWWLLGVPLPLAIAFGGVVAPPDAVAATTVAKRIGLPRQLVSLLEGESLFNDATALVIVRMGLVALGTTVSVAEVGGQFLWAAGGGVAIGVLAAFLIGLVRRRITHTVTDTALSLRARGSPTCPPRRCTRPACWPWSPPGCCWGTSRCTSRPPSRASPSASTGRRSSSSWRTRSSCSSACRPTPSWTAWPAPGSPGWSWSARWCWPS